MSPQAVFRLIECELQNLGIYQVSVVNRAYPQSMYFGKYRKDLVQIRVSTHAKPYAPERIEINILVRDGMTESEALTEARFAAQKLEEEEDRLVQEEVFAVYNGR